MKDETKLTLRIPVQLRDALASAAQANFRSLNSEIISRLFESIKEKESE